MPNLEEVKGVVFSLNGDSDSGTDGLKWRIYQSCWDFGEIDVITMVQDFSQGNSLPKSTMHSNLVLIPKKEIIQYFLNLRPVRFSSFLKKILSRIIYDRLEFMLPNLISHHPIWICES